HASPVLSCSSQNNCKFKFSSSVSQDTVKDDSLRDDLRFYFMNPCEKYQARKHIPWKLGVQVLKIIMVTTQLVLFGLSNQLVVSYKEESTMAFKQLFVRDYGGEDQDGYCTAVFTQQDFYHSVFYATEQYSQLGQLSVGPLSYSEDENGNLLPFVICKNLYRKRNLDPSKQVFEIDTELEKVCLSFDPKLVKQWKMQNSSFFDLDFYRLIGITVTFQLNGINLQTVRLRELPDCYTFNITINFDNSVHSGKLKIYLNLESSSFACKQWKIYGSAEKNMHLFLVFDCFVILVCLTSALLCARSMILAIRLLQRFSKFLLENHERKMCEDDQKEFLNGWYVLVIISDLLAIIGSVLKIEIQAKYLTSYDVCSIFLGTSTLLVWVSVIRYLGYFEKYNVLILTMRVAFPKVLRFCCCAGMIYLGYTFCGWIVLGPYHEKFEQLSRVAECLFSLLNGDDMFATFAQLKDTNSLVWFFSRVYLYSFISVFIYMVLSLFIALITDSYETAQDSHKQAFPLTDLQRFLTEQLESSEAPPSPRADATSGFSVFCCRRR
uniref:Mucolipin TRP cation channel 2 n=1 Tax=Tetraodon nigroviridis TaxID=99883 RepID=H3DDN0_TETNG